VEMCPLTDFIGLNPHFVTLKFCLSSAYKGEKKASLFSAQLSFLLGTLSCSSAGYSVPMGCHHQIRKL